MLKQHNPENPHVFLDISIGGARGGRMVFELFADIVPKTAVPRFHRVIKGFMAQGGDTTNHNGTAFGLSLPNQFANFLLAGQDELVEDLPHGVPPRTTSGCSIYGREFKDENFSIRHTQRGLLSMANAGPHTNNSQFFITFKDVPHLDGKHVVFGRLVSGQDVLHRMEAVQTNREDKPMQQIVITHCGEIEVVSNAEEEKAAREKQEKQTKEDAETTAKAKRETKAEMAKRQSDETREEIQQAVQVGLVTAMQNKKKKLEEVNEAEQKNKKPRGMLWDIEDDFATGSDDEGDGAKGGAEKEKGKDDSEKEEE